MIRNKTRKLPDADQKLKLHINTSIHNRFDVEVIERKTGIVKQKAYAENVICNQMWDRLFAKGTWNRYIHVGSGSGTPSETDTKLFSFLSAKSSSFEKYTSESGVYSVTKKMQLLETENVGAILTEVGIGYDNAASSLCTHAMLQDMNGNPISILKTDTDIINIYSTVFAHYDVNGYNGIFLFGNNQRRAESYSYGILPFLTEGYSVGQFSYGAAQPPSRYAACASATTFYYSAVGKNGVSFVSSMNSTYDVQNKKIICDGQRVGANAGNDYKNAYNIVALTSGSGYSEPSFMIPAKVLFPDGIEVNADVIGTGDGSTTDFTTTFPGIYNCRVFVDGVEETVICDERVPFMLGNGENGRLFEVYKKDDFGVYRPHYKSIASTYTLSAGEELVLKNPFYASIGVKEFKYFSSLTSLYASNNGENWNYIGTGSNTSITIPVQYRKNPWFKIVNESSGNDTFWGFYDSYGTIMDKESNANIHFSTPPAPGSVITASYKTETIAKDINHVFDFSMEIEFNSYNQ